MKLSAQLGFALVLGLTSVVGCGSDDPVTGETGGRAQTGGQGTGSKSDAGTRRDAGKGTSSAGGGTGSGSDDDDSSACENLNLPARPNSPAILIVLDRSGSMVGFGGSLQSAGVNRWAPSVSAVKAVTSALTETVEFGLMVFPSTSGGGGGFPGLGGGCTPGTIDVPVGLNTADQIASVLDMSMPNTGSTPTSASLVAAREALDTGTCGDCVEQPRYVLLVTDGQPTCGAAGGLQSTQADVDATNAAIDALTELKIKTYVIGYDTLPGTPEGNAMQSFAEHGGTEKFFQVEDEQSLVAELTRIAGLLVPCEFELSGTITNPSFVRVEIDGKTYTYGEDWQIEGDNKIVLDPMGAACPLLRDAKAHFLRITRECEEVIAI